MTTSLTAIKPLLNELKRDLQELYGDRLVKLILFGSHARGEANLDSDIDLLAVLKSPVSQVIIKVGAGTGSQPLQNMNFLVGAMPPCLPCYASSKRCMICVPRNIS